MKKKNNYLKEAGVLLIAIGLIATCMTVTANIKVENDYVELFKQEPTPPGDPMPYGWISDLDYGDWKCIDDFWDVTRPICDIHWWTLGLIEIGEIWYPCDPEGMVFTITFYEGDESGIPGDVVCSYENVMPTITGTGIIYDYPDEPGVPEPTEMYYFEAQLSTCCNLEEGWVSIVKTYSPNDCIFGSFESQDGNGHSFQHHPTWGWIHLDHDFAFMLTGINNPPEKPIITGPSECKTGENYIYYASTTDPEGDDISYLFDWGDGGTSFIMGPYESGVECNASAIWFEEGTYNVTVKAIDIHNAESEWSDPLIVSLPKIKVKNTFFLTFLENHPHIFPLLRQILGL